MNEFKVGDKVMRVAGYHQGMVRGDVAIVERVVDRFSMYLEGYKGQHDPANFELVVDTEKESITSWLKENRWHIRTGSPEKSELVQKWLADYGYFWIFAKGKLELKNFSDDYLTNTTDCGEISEYIMHGHNSYGKINSEEITIEFETVVKSVKLPEQPKPTEQELKLEELEKTIKDAQQQIAQLKEMK